MMTLESALEIVDTWLSAEFEGGRHEKRIKQIEQETEHIISGSDI